MKTFALTLFLCFSIFATCDIYANTNTIIANYPAPSGTYNKIFLNTQASTYVDCSQQSNQGLLYMNTSLNTLELCATSNNGALTQVKIPYPETCFNRFCSWYDSNSQSTVFASPSKEWCSQLGKGCPAGYSWAPTQSSPLQYADIITTNSSSPYYHIESGVCCNTLSTVHP